MQLDSNKRVLFDFKHSFAFANCDLIKKMTKIVIL